VIRVVDLNGRLEVTFSIDTAIFIPGQTVCQTDVSGTDSWNSETCLTEVEVQSEVLRYTCNMIGAS